MSVKTESERRALPWYDPEALPRFEGDDKHCRHPRCRETNWGGYDRVHLRSDDCPPIAAASQCPAADSERDERLRTLAALLLRHGHVDWDAHDARTVANAVMEGWAAPLLAEQAATIAKSGDEHHTMDELYEYRMLYNAHAALGWQALGYTVVKSWRHSDGEECFGGGWFIVVANLPTGQVSNHYAAEHWDLFDVPDVWYPPEYDGHTPADAADRLRAALGSQRTEGQG